MLDHTGVQLAAVGRSRGDFQEMPSLDREAIRAYAENETKPVCDLYLSMRVAHVWFAWGLQERWADHGIVVRDTVVPCCSRAVGPRRYGNCWAPAQDSYRGGGGG